jgi:site-specific recombinase XerD
MKVNFSLKPSKKGKDGKAPINIDISFKGDRIIIFSGKRCNPDNWNGKRVTGNEEFKEDTNAILAAHERKLMAIESDAIKKGIVLTKDYIKTKFSQDEEVVAEAKVVDIGPIELPDDFWKLMQKFIDDTKNGVRKSQKGKKLGKDSVQVAEATKMHLETFCREKRYRLTFSNINEKFYKKFTDYLYDDLDHYDNTVGKYIRNLKTFLNWSEKTTVQSKKWFKVPSEEKDIMVLTPEQLNALIDVEINEATVNLNYFSKKKTVEPESKEETIEMMNRTRDIFVLGCTTTLRVSDLLKLDPQTNLIKATNYKLKINTSAKTGKSILIDLPDYTESIINKYIKKYNKILPPITDQRFNENLKKLGEFMNWDQIKIEVVRHKRYEPVKKTMTLSSLLTSHVMRRTGITTLLIGGMDPFAVKKISGHSKNSRSFTKYIEFSQAYINTEYKKAWENIRNMGYGKSVMKVS